MTTMFANDVRQTLDHFRRSVDQLFENTYGYAAQAARPSGDRSEFVWSPALESAWNNTALYLRAIVPGVTANELKVSIQNNQLIVEGERKTPEGFERNAYTQLVYGRFYTAVTLPNGLDLEKMSCRLHDGILDIQVPVAEASKPRQIRIETGEQQKAISA
jgi:HSP20 family protein